MSSIAAEQPGGARSAAPATGSAHRVIFIDLARALAVYLMVHGHTVSALLAPEYREGPLFGAWVFQRGLTSCMFLLLSGFAFSVATSRHWSAHVHVTGALFRRVRRFALFIVLGYALHFPVSRFALLAETPEERWRSFLAVDVLQLIGVTFVGVQVLVLLTRTQRAFLAAALTLGALAVVVTPAAWAIDWTTRLPLALAAYLSPGTGSQFPLLPWAGYVFLGAGLGQLYSRWGAAHLATFARRVLFGGGAAMLLTAAICSRVPFEPFGPTDIWSNSPNQFLIRAGSVLLVLGALAMVSVRLRRLPHVFAAVAQESLLVYFVHLCIVYGSVWNRGLRHHLGALDLLPTFGVVFGVLAAMTLLAWAWNTCKHASPRFARAAMAAAAAWAVWQLR